jgi:hypothetical protein
MPKPDPVMRFATRLHAMKLRSNRSYEALARRVGTSSSSLHRYCRGVTVPSDYDVIARFGRACGATDEEAADLLHCWVLATGPVDRFAVEVPAAVRPPEPAPVLRRPTRFVLLLLAVVAYLARRSVQR